MDFQDTIQNQQGTINDNNQTINDLRNINNNPEQTENELKNLRGQVSSLQNEMNKKQTTIEQQTQRIRELEQQAENLVNQANEKDVEINRQKQQIQGLTQQVENLNQQIQDLNKQIERLTPKKPADEFTRSVASSQCSYTIEGNTITFNRGFIESVDCKNPEQITEIILNRDVSRVEEDVFSDFTKIKTVVINCLPSGIRDGAFLGTAITTVKVKNHITNQKLNQMFGFHSRVKWQIEKQSDYTVCTIQSVDEDIFDDDE